VPATKKSLNINLVVKEAFGESFTEQLLSWILTYGRYIIIITQIVVLSVFFLRFKIDREHTDLKEQIAEKQSIVESFADTEANIRQIQTKLSHIRQVVVDQDALFKVIYFLQEQTPVDTSYSSLTLTSEKISLSAAAGSLKSFSYLLREFQQGQKFSEVVLENVVRRPDGRVEFKISAKVNLKGFI